MIKLSQYYISKAIILEDSVKKLLMLSYDPYEGYLIVLNLMRFKRYY